MKIYGLNKTTLLDYPGKVAATVFLGSCNYRCPFCHNSSLLSPDREMETIPEETLFSFLKKRAGILDGVCITGGEPTLSAALPDLIRKIREMGYAVKLDTNGTNPSMLKFLLDEGLLDRIAMDIKTSPENYPVVSGCTDPGLDRVRESVSLIMQSGIDYEFRTTVVRELHTLQDFRSIGRWISGAKAYYLQAYKDSAEVLCQGFSSYTRAELEEFQAVLRETLPMVEIRGID